MSERMRRCEHEQHSHSLLQELMHHFPYAVFSVAFSLIVLSVLTDTIGRAGDTAMIARSADSLFHSFHFLHIIFAATGAVITFMRFSRSAVGAFLVGSFSPAIFCTLSDAILPYFGGRMLGVSMQWHLCFYSELMNVLPFLLFGLINGFIVGRHHHSRLASFSVNSHFVHVLISSLASSLYLLAHGFVHWSDQIGLVFLFLIVAVLVPCTMSDVIVPMIFARMDKKK